VQRGTPIKEEIEVFTLTMPGSTIYCGARVGSAGTSREDIEKARWVTDWAGELTCEGASEFLTSASRAVHVISRHCLLLTAMHSILACHFIGVSLTALYVPPLSSFSPCSFSAQDSMVSLSARLGFTSAPSRRMHSPCDYSCVTTLLVISILNLFCP
jgi:hypothetical protein